MYFLFPAFHVKFTEFTSEGITGRYFSKFGSKMYEDTFPFSMANISTSTPKKKNYLNS